MTESAGVHAHEPQAGGLALGRLLRRRRAPVSFADLVWAHDAHQKARTAGARPDEDAEARYHEYLRAFEAVHGEVVEAYWCVNEISAVALTMKRPPLLLRPFKDNVLRIHRASDWATREAPQLTRLLHECDTLAVKASSVLRETTQRIAMQWVFSLMSFLLSAVDRARGRPDAEETARLTEAYRLEHARIEQYYREAAVRAAQIVYFWGMVLGMMVLVLIAVVSAPLLWEIGAESDHLRVFYACYAAGAIGAFVSVLQRVTSGHFAIDYELARSALRRLGSFRPFIGAVFGVAVYFIVESGVLHVTAPAERPQNFFFLVMVAFIAGFSERFAKDLLDEAAAIGSAAGAAASSGPSPDGTVELATPPAQAPLPVERPGAAAADEPAEGARRADG